VVAAFVVGLAMIPVLIRRSRTHPEPLLELDLFRLRSFSSTNAGLAFYSMAFTSGFLANSLLLQELWGESLRTTGLALVPSPLLAACISPFAGRLADRLGHRWILTVGSAACGLAYLSYVVVLDSTPATWTVFVPISLLVGFGVGATIATWSSAGLADVGPAQFGTANATVRTTQQVFYALGISVIVALLADVSSDPDVGRFRWAWAFVGTAYLASAVTVALTFPAGSSDDRAADAATA
jgi:MFS family permease